MYDEAKASAEQAIYCLFEMPEYRRHDILNSLYLLIEIINKINNYDIEKRGKIIKELKVWETH